MHVMKEGDDAGTYWKQITLTTASFFQRHENMNIHKAVQKQPRQMSSQTGALLGCPSKDQLSLSLSPLPPNIPKDKLS
jgi:hypothetical protein